MSRRGRVRVGGEQQRPARPSAPARLHADPRPPPRSCLTAPLRAVRRPAVTWQRKLGATRGPATATPPPRSPPPPRPAPGALGSCSPQL